MGPACWEVRIMGTEQLGKPNNGARTPGKTVIMGLERLGMLKSTNDTRRRLKTSKNTSCQIWLNLDLDSWLKKLKLASPNSRISFETTKPEQKSTKNYKSTTFLCSKTTSECAQGRNTDWNKAKTDLKPARKSFHQNSSHRWPLLVSCWSYPCQKIEQPSYWGCTQLQNTRTEKIAATSITSTQPTLQLLLWSPESELLAEKSPAAADVAVWRRKSCWKGDMAVVRVKCHQEKNGEKKGVK